MRRFAWLALLGLAALAPDAAAADPPAGAATSTATASATAGSATTASASTSSLTHEEEPDWDAWFLRQKHTLAELETGIIALPNAPIAGQRGGNLPFGTVGHGDATLLLGGHLLYRGGRDWSIGAGVMFAPRPTSDDTYGGASGLSRSHSRSYLTMGAEARYIPLHFKTAEVWFGGSAAALVVADRFTTNAGDPVPEILGKKDVTVRTEGLSFGLQAGGDYLFAERVFLGLALRFNHWILPSTPTCTPVGDCATLTGPVTELELGIRLGYRIPL